MTLAPPPGSFTSVVPILSFVSLSPSLTVNTCVDHPCPPLRPTDCPTTNCHHARSLTRAHVILYLPCCTFEFSVYACVCVSVQYIPGYPIYPLSFRPPCPTLSCPVLSHPGLALSCIHHRLTYYSTLGRPHPSSSRPPSINPRPPVRRTLHRHPPHTLSETLSSLPTHFFNTYTPFQHHSYTLIFNQSSSCPPPTIISNQKKKEKKSQFFVLNL